MRETGKYVKSAVAGEEVKAFVPLELPPRDPPFKESESLRQQQNKAETAVAELRIASHLVPNVDLFAYAFVRQEAVSSSQIEGVQATLSDLLNFEAVPEEFGTQDVVEVCNYLDALIYGKKQLENTEGLPLSLRLIREIHRRLMKKGRGATKNPGEFRTTQNWIGGSRPGTAHFVPPPPKEMLSSLEDFEKFLHTDSTLVHPLTRISWIHVQFETIHPFLDGNGRVGRLLIALLLEVWCDLDARLLYLSLFFKKNRGEYYRRLDAVRTDGDWEGWTEFFLQGVTDTAKLGVETARVLFKIFDSDRKRLMKHGDTVMAAIRLLEELPSHPILTIQMVTQILKMTKPTAGKAVDILCDLGILEERTGGKRNRVFGYRAYINALKARDEG
jgi:Fic family protein